MKYLELLEALKACKCPECRGLGEVNDAEPGDTQYNTWECETCQGTGFRRSQRKDKKHA
ncbi:hypothetical protein PR1_76 [Providencia phage vB_PreS_PR1]|uniref:Antitermination protein Q n=1 Tax=Providencia phage vB_PreS_PR1 TaxID=1931407 RepID=A0A1S6KV85_9CAUD|nr:anti-termination protein Q-like [Providencia phage vB_PreS_PR1]AQT25357.1 hypothetical protein PR1_76 [Providencia phage vB_PreS_PR1]